MKHKQKIAATEVSKRDRILDVAEELFALHGFDGVTMRQIAQGAGVDVALANYHFGRKRAVFDAVFERRAGLLNAARLDALREVQAKAGQRGPDVEEIIGAFLRPLEMAQEHADAGWRNYLALIAYANNSPVWGREIISRLFNDLVQEFIAALKKALPGHRDEDIYWCYHYLSGTLTLTFADTGRIDVLSRGKCKSSDFKAAYDRMVPYTAAGFRRVCLPAATESSTAQRRGGVIPLNRVAKARRR
jgi:AcrR family transcriptional regulator